MDRTLDAEVLAQWVGRTETAHDVIDAKQAMLMAATLGEDAPGQCDALPPLWHWIYFPVAKPPSELGRDGHPKLGGFLPPVALPRRMWAGGRFVFSHPLRVGDAVEKRSEIKSVALKQGRTGALCFVTVEHVFSVEGKVRLREEHDIVYREDPSPDAPKKALPTPPGGAEASMTFAAPPVTLFRYSALTFNGHRIHYDRDYCREVEGYPDLVVHGPLIGTLLAGFAVAQKPEMTLKSYGFRAVSPICGSMPFSLNAAGDGDGLKLWAVSPEGALAMQAEATFS